MKNPPIHIIQNMDDVGRLDPQSQNLASYLIEDSIVFISPHKMSMMKPVEGTVPRSNDNFIADMVTMLDNVLELFIESIVDTKVLYSDYNANFRRFKNYFQEVKEGFAKDS